LHGTGLEAACIIANNPDKLIESIQEFMQKDFSAEEIQKRRRLLAEYYDNNAKTKKLLSFIS
jgi:hypothetical protein